MSVIKRLCMNMLEKDESTKATKRRIARASLTDEYRERILFGELLLDSPGITMQNMLTLSCPKVHYAMTFANLFTCELMNELISSVG